MLRTKGETAAAVGDMLGFCVARDDESEWSPRLASAKSKLPSDGSHRSLPT